MTLESAPLYNIRKLQRHQNLAYLFVCKFPEIFKKERSINRSRTRRNFHSQKPVYKQDPRLESRHAFRSTCFSYKFPEFCSFLILNNYVKGQNTTFESE